MVAQHFNHSFPAFAMMDFDDSNTERDNHDDEFVFLLVRS
jgi:hypothetical protein